MMPKFKDNEYVLYGSCLFLVKNVTYDKTTKEFVYSIMTNLNSDNLYIFKERFLQKLLPEQKLELL